MSGFADTYSDGHRENYFECLKIPNATVRIRLIIYKLDIGNGRSDIDQCRNTREDHSVNHISVMNGREELFYCSDISFDKPVSIRKDIVANTLEFNLTVGSWSAAENTWFHMHYECELLLNQLILVVKLVKFV